jgi:hypothetical protein
MSAYFLLFPSGFHTNRIFVRKPEGKRSLRRLRSSWVDNIKMDLREIGLGGMDWTDLAQNRNQWRVLVNGDEPSGSIKCWEVLE